MKSKLIYLALLCIIILSSCNTKQEKILTPEEQINLINENGGLKKQN